MRVPLSPHVPNNNCILGKVLCILLKPTEWLTHSWHKIHNWMIKCLFDWGNPYTVNYQVWCISAFRLLSEQSAFPLGCLGLHFLSASSELLRPWPFYHDSTRELTLATTTRPPPLVSHLGGTFFLLHEKRRPMETAGSLGIRLYHLTEITSGSHEYQLERSALWITALTDRT